MTARPQSESSGEAWTILRLIRWTTEYLEKKGVESPRLDAEVLLADLLHLSRVDLYVNFDRPLNAAELADFRRMILRRAAREPVAYIIGRKEFFSLDFAVGPEVLIPRPETEHLAEEAVRLTRERWPDSGEVRLVDVGTGSGALALALAHEIEAAAVWALDISAPALHMASSNARRHRLEDRIRFIQGDLLAPLADSGRRFHLILANLPYVPRAAFAAMAPEVREYEPHLALDGGEDGLVLIRRVVASSRDFLSPDGALLLEVWPGQVGEIERLALDRGFTGVEVVRDLAGRDRIMILDNKPSEE